MTLPGATIGQATDQVRLLTEEISVLQQQIRRTIESRLQQFHGWAFGSLEENQRFAKMIHQLLDNHGLRVACPECSNPSILRCLRAGNAKHGVFVFDHYLESGRTFHGGPTTVPLLRVVNKPYVELPAAAKIRFLISRRVVCSRFLHCGIIGADFGEIGLLSSYLRDGVRCVNAVFGEIGYSRATCAMQFVACDVCLDLLDATLVR